MQTKQSRATPPLFGSNIPGDNHPRARYWATRPHWSPQEFFRVSFLPFPALLFLGNSSNGCGLSSPGSPVFYLLTPTQCFPCDPVSCTLTPPPKHVHIIIPQYLHIRVPGLPRMSESKDAQVPCIKWPSLFEGPSSVNSTKCVLVPLGLAESADAEIGFQKSECIISFVLLPASPVSLPTSPSPAILWTKSLNRFNNPLSICPAGSSSPLNRA